MGTTALPERNTGTTERQHRAGVYPDPRKVHFTTGPLRSYYPPPVIFEELNLFMKWESRIHISEAQCNACMLFVDVCMAMCLFPRCMDGRPMATQEWSTTYLPTILDLC
ncbi:hypothetical protein P170DRAFT_499163, partial [Aspergillus steynii IBT 23096]